MTELEGQDNRKPQFVGMYVSVAVFLPCAIFRNGAPSLKSLMVWFFMLAAASALFRAVSTDCTGCSSGHFVFVRDFRLSV